MPIGRYGEPRHDHWESDYARTSCAAPDCNEALSIFFRHHCRRCGKLFCPKCVGGGLQRRLNQNAELDPRGVLSPVCYECYLEDNGWFSERGSAAWNQATASVFVDRTGIFLPSLVPILLCLPPLHTTVSIVQCDVVCIAIRPFPSHAVLPAVHRFACMLVCARGNSRNNSHVHLTAYLLSV